MHPNDMHPNDMAVTTTSLLPDPGHPSASSASQAAGPVRNSPARWPMGALPLGVTARRPGPGTSFVYSHPSRHALYGKGRVTFMIVDSLR
jgi:hypothetical protein